MATSRFRFFAKLLPFALGALLSACSTMDTKQEVLKESRQLQKGPEIAPARSITNFSAGLRCMDNLLLEYGVRDVAIITEDILDETKKVNAGTKDMLISAVSDMTRRSRAIRLIAYGKDSGNTIGYLFQAQDRTLYDVIPMYSIKGSISQFDESIARKNVDGGVSIEPFLSIGAAKTAATSVLGLDLTVLSTRDLSVVSGVTSRNQVLIIKDGKGVDGEATIKKFGINFSMNLSRAEGNTQALRTLVELASIELVGRLARVPYWTCVGADPNDELVRNEISDWYEAMRVDPKELLGWGATQMRQRGLYDGPIDGSIDASTMEKLKVAIADYRAALGMSREPKLSLDFYTAYLRANHAELAPKVAAALPKAAPEAAKVEPLTLALLTANGKTQFSRGDAVNLIVKPGRDAHVYCYLRDEFRKIQRFYPNRFAKDSLVRTGAPLQLPGAMGFRLIANDKGVVETVACFATDRDVMRDLPPSVIGTDFENLAVDSLEQVKSAFVGLKGSGTAQAYFNVEIR
jgi:Domain of unknown function (DUF4384)